MARGITRAKLHRLEPEREQWVIAAHDRGSPLHEIAALVGLDRG